jgi:hypothetical protein
LHPAPDTNPKGIAVTAPTRLELTSYTTADVVHITFGKHPHHEGVVTGVVMGEKDGYTLVRMYSAGCLHGFYSVPTDEITKVERY